MNTKQKNQTTRKSNKNSKKKKSKFATALTVIIVILGCIWFVSGKPVLVFDEDSFSAVIVQTEPPLWETLSNPTITEEPQQSPAPQIATPINTNSSGNNITEHDLNHAENTGLYFGNPSDAIFSVEYEENYLLEKEQYAVSYNNKTLIPNWVAWHLDSSNIGDADRSDNFRPDTTLPEGWYRVKKADYQFNKYGFDRGHVCPSADRTSSIEDNEITFLMTNMVPQAPDCNRIVWKNLEEYERSLVLDGNEVYIFAGPAGIGGVSGTGTWEYITISQKNADDLQMLVPEYTWKVIMAIPEGDNDIDRVTTDATVIAVMIPNKQGVHKNANWETYRTSIDEIERTLGYDFFELLDDSIEDVLEAKIN